IAAGKGGVGKSTVSANLAFALRARGKKVGLLDTDVYGPSMRRMLPEDRLPEQRGDQLIPALSYGVELMTMAYFRSDDQAAAIRAPIANGLVTQFLQTVAWSDLDYLLIDFPPGTGDIQLTLAQKGRISAALMVTTPQEVAVMDVRKAMDLFDQVRIPVVGIVENMSYLFDAGNGERNYIFGKGGGERLAREKGLPLLAELPLHPDLSRAADEGRALPLQNPQHPMSEAFDALAENLESHMTALEAQRTEGLGSFELVWQEMAT
ncbi:MAG: Mrp/NBP35 family ATP-binding protein, partial [Chlamydiia bacterium]|nr:Mrp/NBP35 family ATP-binding protein [Chlamydiia bacterium]